MWIGIAIVLLLLWAGGFFAFHVAGFLIHILLILAVVSFVTFLGYRGYVRQTQGLGIGGGNRPGGRRSRRAVRGGGAIRGARAVHRART